MAGLNIAPSISHHETCGQVDIELSRRLEQKARPRLAAITVVRIVVVTNPDFIQRQLVLQPSVDLFDASTRLRASCDIWLV
jgi:hypothetical protein